MTGRSEFRVFGRRVFVERAGGGWSVSYPGPDGKRRLADDIVIPPAVTEAELGRYLADLCHEWATPEHPDVQRVETAAGEGSKEERPGRPNATGP